MLQQHSNQQHQQCNYGKDTGKSMYVCDHTYAKDEVAPQSMTYGTAMYVCDHHSYLYVTARKQAPTRPTLPLPPQQCTYNTSPAEIRF